MLKKSDRDSSELIKHYFYRYHILYFPQKATKNRMTNKRILIDNNKSHTPRHNPQISIEQTHSIKEADTSQELHLMR